MPLSMSSRSSLDVDCARSASCLPRCTSCNRTQGRHAYMSSCALHSALQAIRGAQPLLAGMCPQTGMQTFNYHTKAGLRIEELPSSDQVL